MKAWLLDRIGTLDSIRIDHVADPVPGAGEVVLDMEFAALNPADRYLAEGLYPARPAFPHILGRDGIGAIAALGPDVDPGLFPIGQRRTILRGEMGVSRPGTFAQRVAVPVDSLALPPDDWTPQQAGSAPLVYLTAHQALTMWGPMEPGIVLVSGASGGVGVASIHLARALLHEVVALSRDQVKRQRLREQGAAHVLDPSDPRWVRTLRATLGDRRVNLAIDNIGGDLFPRLIETLGDDAKVSCVGRLAGPVPSFNTATLFFRRLRLGGVAVGSCTPAQTRQSWADVLRLLSETGARPLVDSVHAFTDLKDAFAKLAAGPMGKVLLKIQ